MALDGAKTVGSVKVEIKADNDNFIASLRRMENESKKAGKTVKDTFSAAELKTKAWNNALAQTQGRLVGLVAVGALIAIGKQAIDAADKFTQMRSKINLVIDSTNDLVTVETDLYNLAQRNRSDLEATVTLYARLRGARKDLSDMAAQEIVENWSKTLVISGASASEAASATMQFAQAMASGRLQGDELRSILENNSRFANLLADSLGTNIGGLRKLGEEGKLTVDVIGKAMREGGAKLASEAEGMQKTTSQAWQQMGNAVTRLVGLLDKGTGAAKLLADAIDGISNAIDWLSGLLGGNQTVMDKSLALQERFNKFLAETDHLIENINIGDLTDDVDKLWAALGRSNPKLQKMRDLLVESGQAARDAQMNIATGFVLELYADLEELQREQAQVIRKFEGEQLRKRGGPPIDWQAQAALQAQQSPEMNALNARIAAVLKSISEAEKRAKDLLVAPLDNFKPPPEEEDDKDGKKPKEDPLRKVQEYKTAFDDLYTLITDLQTAGPDLIGDRSSGALKALSDYLQQTGDIVTVLTLMGQLQQDFFDADGVLLSKGLFNPEDLIRLQTIIDDWQTATTPDLDQMFGKDYGSAEPIVDIPEFEFDESMWDLYHDDLARNTASAFAEGIMSGDWGDAFESILGNTLETMLSDAVNNLGKLLTDVFAKMDWNSLFSGIGQFLGGLGGSIFGGARAGAGEVKKGMGYTVNENKKERFITRDGRSMDLSMMPGGKFVAPEDGWVVPREKPFAGLKPRGYGGARAASQVVQPLSLQPFPIATRNSARPVTDTGVKVGDFTFNNYGTADAMTRAEFYRAMAEHRRMFPAALQKWKADRIKRGDL
jgi:tape measure domain-containing protein